MWKALMVLAAFGIVGIIATAYWLVKFIIWLCEHVQFV
jgi:hypothetical protein